jgi:hypothetical protein
MYSITTVLSSGQVVVDVALTMADAWNESRLASQKLGVVSVAVRSLGTVQ